MDPAILLGASKELRPTGKAGGRVVLPELWPEVSQGEEPKGRGLHLLLTRPGAEAPPRCRVGGAGRRQLGFKVRLFLKWRRQRAEKGWPQGEVYGSVPQGPTLSRGWRPQPRCGGERAGLWRVPRQRLLVRKESCPKPQAAPLTQPLLAEGPVAGSMLGWALFEPSCQVDAMAWWQPGAVVVLGAEVWGLCGPSHFTESHHFLKQRRHHTGLHGRGSGRLTGRPGSATCPF